MLIKANELLSGMCVDRPVTDSGGRVLLKKGTLLTASLIVRLKIRKIVAVHIADQEAKADNVERGPDLQTRMLLDKLFAKIDGQPLMADIKEAALRCVRISDNN